MGLFTSTRPPPTTPKPSPDGAFEAPDRSARAHCWEARDGFFACLEKNGIIDSIKEKEVADERCGKEGKVFERDCAKSWVQYFKKRRVMEHKRDLTIAKIDADNAALLAAGGKGASIESPKSSI
ncbi:MAG: hypothetical protein M1835_005791 [Candelina submexicana]|nr:MAG: hypothetical protein M1835_005791 [Candelina submexicana]